MGEIAIGEDTRRERDCHNAAALARQLLITRFFARLR